MGHENMCRTTIVQHFHLVTLFDLTLTFICIRHMPSPLLLHLWEGILTNFGLAAYHSSLVGRRQDEN